MDCPNYSNAFFVLLLLVTTPCVVAAYMWGWRDGHTDKHDESTP